MAAIKLKVIKLNGQKRTALLQSMKQGLEYLERNEKNFKRVILLSKIN